MDSKAAHTANTAQSEPAECQHEECVHVHSAVWRLQMQHRRCSLVAAINPRSHGQDSLVCGEVKEGVSNALARQAARPATKDARNQGRVCFVVLWRSCGGETAARHWSAMRFEGCSCTQDAVLLPFVASQSSHS